MTVRLQVDLYDNYVPYPQYLKLLVRATDTTSSGIKDFSGYGRVGTVSGATGSFGVSRINPYSISFPGSAYIVFPAGNDFDASGDFTLSVWVYFTNVTGLLMIASNQDALPGVSGWQFYYNSGSIYVDGATNSAWAWTPVINTFYHFALLKVGSAISFYVNGINLGTKTAPMSNSGLPLYVGVGRYSGSAYPTWAFTGYMDELTIWSGKMISIDRLFPQFKPFSFRRA